MTPPSLKKSLGDEVGTRYY